MKIKTKILLTVSLLMMIVGCSLLKSNVPYQSISATETGVLAANSAYLDSVVSGVVKTNGVPAVERAFNDVQMALHAAAAVAAGGSTAPVPATVLAQAIAFTNTVTINSIKN